ncbi:MAG: hypothetical protein HKL98_07650 [Burkholderiales bacterium]|nr:hypothetical protein [Burkholderiales bacterium]
MKQSIGKIVTTLFFASAIAAAHAGDGSSGAKGQMGAGDNRGSIGGKGSGQGGPSSDSTSKGPRYSGGSQSNHPEDGRGNPSWSHDALPEGVELGRLNVARAPAHVLEKSLADALSSLDSSFYRLPSLDAVLKAISSGKLPDGSTFTSIDSPLENLALYKAILTDGKIGDGSKIVVNKNNTELLLAVFLGSAADKTIPITADTVNALSTILQVSLPAYISAEKLAADADQVRTAILDAHSGE